MTSMCMLGFGPLSQYSKPCPLRPPQYSTPPYAYDYYSGRVTNFQTVSVVFAYERGAVKIYILGQIESVIGLQRRP